MKRIHNSKNNSVPEQDTTLTYIFKDQNGKIIESKKAREIVLEKYPSKKSLQKQKQRTTALN